MDYQFKKVMARFPIPCNTCWIKLAIEFVGNIIACTYYIHGSDKMVVLESIDKCGIVSFVKVRIGVYFRL